VDELTPIRRQYLDVKRRYPHAIVFFRLGDFYETFDDDAELCSRELDITLTSKPMGKGLRVPLAGIPYHAVDGYIAKLIAKGYKVALCEQMSDPATTKGIVDRQVVRVVTPGTVIEGNLLDERANNYLACLAPARRAGRTGSGDGWQGDVGFAYVDISTGEFVAGALTQDQAAAELARIRPAEVLVPDGGAAPRLDAHHERRAALVRPRPCDRDGTGTLPRRFAGGVRHRPSLRRGLGVRGGADVLAGESGGERRARLLDPRSSRRGIRGS
jgi:DNA mismatch repair protein MutS